MPCGYELPAQHAGVIQPLDTRILPPRTVTIAAAFESSWWRSKTAPTTRPSDDRRSDPPGTSLARHLNRIERIVGNHRMGVGEAGADVLGLQIRVARSGSRHGAYRPRDRSGPAESAVPGCHRRRCWRRCV